MALYHFWKNSPQPTPWKILLLLSKCRHNLTMMLHNKQYTNVFLSWSTRRTPPPADNVAPSAYGSISPKYFKEYTINYHININILQVHPIHNYLYQGLKITHVLHREIPQLYWTNIHLCG